jgi:HlyD family secretion protein
MKKYLIIAAAVIAVGVIIAANLMNKEEGTVVETESVTRGTVVQKVTGSGQIRPEMEVKISANVAGKILRLHAEEGDRVEKGRLLVELDQEQYLASVERAESNLLSAKANEKKLKSDFLRATDLHAKGLVSAADFEATQASYEAAESNTRQMAAMLKEARDQLSKTRLHADMSGIVTKLNKEEGEIALGAQFQEDVIMIVADLSRIEAAIEIDENDVVTVTTGDTADIEIDALPDTVFKGIVTKIANSATVRGIGTQEQVTNFEVTVALLEPDVRFRPGMSTTVDIITEKKKEVLKVPIQAVTTREKKTLKKEQDVEEPAPGSAMAATPGDNGKPEMVEVVFVFEDDKAVAKPVKLGISDDQHYEILSGVNDDETVITGPFRILSRTLKDGDMVKMKEEKKDNDKSDRSE